MTLRVAVVSLALIWSACGFQLEPAEPVSVPAEDVVLEAACGNVQLPGGQNPVLPNEPLDEETEIALAEAIEVVEAEGELWTQYHWFIAERSDDRVVLFGRPTVAVAPGSQEYAHAAFSRTGNVWKPDGWGQCSVEVAAQGFGNATWVLDPGVEPDLASKQLSIWIQERNCASGEAPIGRQVLPVVVEEAEQVTITVLVAAFVGGGDCPSNPWHPMMVELKEALGDRALFDGWRVPALSRPWPPTQSSLDSGGSVE